jgi:hypothetical protein
MFVDSDSMMLHLKQNSMTLYSCTLCPARFLHKNAIVRHCCAQHGGTQIRRVIKMLLCAERKANDYQQPSSPVLEEEETSSSGERTPSCRSSVDEVTDKNGGLSSVDVVERAGKGDTQVPPATSTLDQLDETVSSCVPEKALPCEASPETNHHPDASPQHEESRLASMPTHAEPAPLAEPTQSQIGEITPVKAASSTSVKGQTPNLDLSSENLVIDEGPDDEDPIPLAFRQSGVKGHHSLREADEEEADPGNDIVPITDLFGSEDLHGMLVGKLCSDEGGLYHCLLCDPPKDFHKTKKLHEHLFIHTRNWLLRYMHCF